jgi:kynurenine formamidase
VEERNIGAVGHETGDTDAPAAGTNFAGETYILKTDRIQVELMTNLDSVPPTGAIIFVTFPKVKDGMGFPARVFAICPAN